jgi:hypothetical protein
VKFLSQMNGSLDGIQGDAIVTRTIDAPLTFVSRVFDEDRQISLLLTVTCPKDDFFAGVEQKTSLTFILTAGALGLLMYLATGMFTILRREAWPRALDSDLASLGAEHVTQMSLERHMLNIEDLIMEANIKDWRRQQYAISHGFDDQPLDTVQLARHSSLRAMKHVRDAQHGRDVLAMSAAESWDSGIPIAVYDTLHILVC